MVIDASPPASQYLKKGKAFQMRNPIDDQRPQVVLPPRYLEEVMRAPQDRLSFPLFSEQAFCLNYSGGPQQTDATAHIVRVDLTRNLGDLLDGIHAECIAAFQDKMVECNDWTAVRPYEIFAYVVARITARVMVGPELCRNEEWLGLSIGTTFATIGAAMTIREKYSPRWRWLAPWFHPASKAVLANRKRATALIGPLYEKHLRGDTRKPGDGTQWLLNVKKSGTAKTKTVEEITDEHLFLSIASIHTTAASVTQIFYDLIDHPEYHDDLLSEIEQTRTKHNGKWTKQSVGELRKLDSFMKESQRVNPIGFVTIQRSAVRPYTFKDGLHLPAGTQLSMLSYELAHDPELYPEPEKFDAYRFLRMREQIDPNRFHFASVSQDSIYFGAGNHACPGRFFASHEMKLMLVELLLGYEMKFREGEGRPPNMVHDFANTPNLAAEIMFKARKAAA
ncbi:MAG: hypothetical protein M4579_006169 [Chaenotheca gracillima]|nr:MAG: hypothetical protein M4579_006169 [Chaenotheca gracillima]